MFTNERLDLIAKRYGLMKTVPLVQAYVGGLHEVLNLFDSTALMDTSGGIKPAPMGRTGVVAVNPIGARVALHEQAGLTVWREGERPRRYYYHWLGHDACCSCGCGEQQPKRWQDLPATKLKPGYLPKSPSV